MSTPGEAGCHLSIVVPHASHHRLALLVPERDVLIRGLAGKSVERAVQGTHGIEMRREGIAGPDVDPFVEHDARLHRDRLLRALGAAAGWRS